MGKWLPKKLQRKAKTLIVLLLVVVVLAFLFKTGITTERELFTIPQYRAVMEDFSGKKSYSNWVEDKNELERKIRIYPEEGHINLPSEEKTITKVKYTIEIFGIVTLEFTVQNLFDYIEDHFSTLIRVIVFVFLSVILFDFLSVRKRIVTSVSRRLPRKIKRKIGIKRVQHYLETFKQEVEKILPWSAVSYGILILIWIFFAFPLFGNLMTLIDAIGIFLPFILGAIATFIIVSIIVSVVLRITENIEVGDVIEFETHMGKIKKLGFFFTCIRTPKNEKVYIPNIMLSTKTMKKLGKQKIKGERPYIARFETTLSYRIPIGIINSLFFLAIRDTADDFENDFKNERIKKGMECIRGLDDLSKKIEELEKDKEKTEKRIRSADQEERHELEEKRNVLEKRIKELKIQQENWKKYTPFVLIRNLDNYTVNYEFCVCTNHPSQLLKINHYVMKNLKRRFDEFGVEIMSPLQVSKREFNE